MNSKIGKYGNGNILLNFSRRRHCRFLPLKFPIFSVFSPIMSLNGPIRMYRIEPLYDFSPQVDLPTCMYRMRNLYDESPNAEHIKKDDVTLLEMEKYQLNVIQKLEDLKDKVLKMKKDLGIQSEANIEQFQDIVVKANPEYPPLSLWVFYRLLSQTIPVRLVTYIHSSLDSVPESLQKLENLNCSEPCKVSLTVIWRDGNKDHEMMIDPVNQGLIEGEVNIARYIARLLSFNYDTDPIISTQIDNWLEIAHSSLIHGNNKERQAALKSLNSHLGKSSYLVQDSVSLADIVVWSALIQIKLHQNLPANVTKWFKSLAEHEMFASCQNLPFL